MLNDRENILSALREKPGLLSETRPFNHKPAEMKGWIATVISSNNWGAQLCAGRR
jgi:hypothetical protein